MKPLPYTNSAAEIAFYALLVMFALLEFRIRIRSQLNASGSRADRGTFVLAGIGLALGNWAALLTLLLLPIAGLVARIRAEERALLDGLAEQYRRFSAGRARLIPHVW